MDKNQIFSVQDCFIVICNNQYDIKSCIIILVAKITAGVSKERVKKKTNKPRIAK